MTTHVCDFSQRRSWGEERASWAVDNSRAVSGLATNVKCERVDVQTVAVTPESSPSAASRSRLCVSERDELGGRRRRSRGRGSSGHTHEAAHVRAKCAIAEINFRLLYFKRADLFTYLAFFFEKGCGCVKSLKIIFCHMKIFSIISVFI
jgi:hypothetical protein